MRRAVTALPGAAHFVRGQTAFRAAVGQLVALAGGPRSGAPTRRCDGASGACPNCPTSPFSIRSSRYLIRWGGRALNEKWQIAQVRRAAQMAGVRAPLLWINPYDSGFYIGHGIGRARRDLRHHRRLGIGRRHSRWQNAHCGSGSGSVCARRFDHQSVCPIARASPIARGDLQKFAAAPQLGTGRRPPTRITRKSRATRRPRSDKT